LFGFAQAIDDSLTPSEIFVLPNLDEMPVVEPGTPHGVFIDPKP
jgi:hypothetical protein